MTPQERAAAVLDQMVVNLPPRDARDYNEQVIENALRHARRAALLEAAEICKAKASGLESEADFMTEQGDLAGPSDEYRYAGRELWFAAQELTRLAQEG